MRLDPQMTKSLPTIAVSPTVIWDPEAKEPAVDKSSAIRKNEPTDSELPRNISSNTEADCITATP
jgi:hypothetical protein